MDATASVNKGPDVIVLELVRDFQNSSCTLGSIVLSPSVTGRATPLTLQTIERPWKNNAVGESCIPAGEYSVTWTRSPKFGRSTYELHGVPIRSAIRIHPANWAVQLEGCIAFGTVRGQCVVHNSRVAVAEFEQLLATRPFKLKVLDKFTT